MDRSATPWRVLDESPAGDDATAAEDAEAGSPAARLQVSWAVIGGFVLAGSLAIGAFALAASTPRGEVTVEGGTSWLAPAGSHESEAVPTTGSVLVVDVQGAVLHPGLQELAPGSRVGDAIAAAGGYGPRVDAERAGRELNLAATVRDGDRVVIPSRDDPPGSSGPGPSSSGAAGQPGAPVNLNSATASELDALPGIGPVTAQKIIDARAEKPFGAVDELRERKIVGSSTLEKLRDLVTVN